ncbi:hypothetical protein GCM10010515_67430 [Streptomyces fructofermentans]|uniref:Uncharacterized protein n=1 Tax=Streptomyces fructofermentans TaxID=152141 RepID=A0A918NS85_9ACTN|nr:hypothetical protein GCM10010515_67430 [Streptomyces fructofermentans]
MPVCSPSWDADWPVQSLRKSASRHKPDGAGRPVRRPAEAVEAVEAVEAPAESDKSDESGESHELVEAEEAHGAGEG